MMRFAIKIGGKILLKMVTSEKIPPNALLTLMTDCDIILQNGTGGFYGHKNCVFHVGMPRLESERNIDNGEGP